MSDDSPQQGIPVRLRTRADRKRAFEAYDEIRRGARTDGAVVLAKMKDGTLQVLGMQVGLDEIGVMLLSAANALAEADKQRQALRPEPHQDPVQRGVHNQNKPAPRAIALDAQGNMRPPPGETFISCGECGHPRFYVLFREADDTPARYACAHCQNEIVNRRIYHAEGTA